MTTVELLEIQSAYDVWNLAMTYWVTVDDWALVGGVEREAGDLYRIALNHYPANDPTYRQAARMIEPPGSRMPLVGIAARLAEAHEIEEPDWLAPSLIGIVRRLDADWEQTRG